MTQESVQPATLITLDSRERTLVIGGQVLLDPILPNDF